MGMVAKSVTCAVVASLLLASFAGAQQASMKVGGKAPEFRLVGSDGNEYSLAQF